MFQPCSPFEPGLCRYERSLSLCKNQLTFVGTRCDHAVHIFWHLIKFPSRRLVVAHQHSGRSMLSSFTKPRSFWLLLKFINSPCAGIYQFPFIISLTRARKWFVIFSLNQVSWKCLASSLHSRVRLGRHLRAKYNCATGAFGNAWIASDQFCLVRDYWPPELIRCWMSFIHLDIPYGHLPPAIVALTRISVPTSWKFTFIIRS